MATGNRNRAVTLALTPALFAELDEIARSVAGSAVEVVAAERMPDAIARVNYLMGSGYQDSRVREGVCMMDLSIIQLANRITTNQVATWSRPELDYSKISPGDLYRFALWHEVGHRLNDLEKWESLRGAPGDHQLVRWLNEVRADRFAWRKVYPKKRIPRHPAAKSKREIDALLRRMKRLYPPSRSRPRPLSTEPNRAIPASHVEHGIPWAAA